MKYSRFLVLLTPVIVLILFELVFLKPKLFYLILILANFFVFLTIRLITRKGLIGADWWNFLILPICFLTSLFVYSGLVINKFIVHFLFFIITFFIYFYLKNIYYYLIKPDLYKSHTLENFFSFGSFFILFFSASSIYGLQSFLSTPVWLLMIIMLIIVFLVFYQMMWVNKIVFKIALLYILIGCLILLEIAWSISFLPLNYNVTGLILAVCYYMLIGLIMCQIKEALNKKVIKLYLFFGSISILLILLTARWM